MWPRGLSKWQPLPFSFFLQSKFRSSASSSSFCLHEKNKVGRVAREYRISASRLFRASFSASSYKFISQFILQSIYNQNSLLPFSYEHGGLCYHTIWDPSREGAGLDNCYLPAPCSRACEQGQALPYYLPPLLSTSHGYSAILEHPHSLGNHSSAGI